jgi:hypothetical protein
MGMPCMNYDYLAKALKARREQWLGGQKPNTGHASPWFYGSDTGHWDRRPTSMACPRSGYGDTFTYLPGEKRAFFRHGEEVWFYDTAANAWSQVHPTGPALPFGIDATSCYDAKRERIYMGGGSYPVTPAGTNALRIYDLKTNAWVDPKPTGAPCHGSNSYPTNTSMMAYDAASDTVIVFRYGGEKAERGIFVYDPEKNAWTEADAKFPGGEKPERGIFVYDPEKNAWTEADAKFPEKWGQCTSAFFDPGLGVYFFFVAGDSDDNGTMWIYRHRHS